MAGANSMLICMLSRWQRIRRTMYAFYFLGLWRAASVALVSQALVPGYALTPPCPYLSYRQKG